MPNWKKIITSGSNAALNSLTVSNTITGSIFGSLIGNADTATTAGTANAVTSPLIQDLTVEGDFVINDGTYNVFSTRDASLYDSTNGSSSLNWDSRTLIDSYTSKSIDWENRKIHYSNETIAIDYSNTSSLTIKNNDNLGSILITSSTMNIDASDSFKIRNLSNNSSATGSISSAGSTLTIGKNSTLENNIAGDFTIKSPITTISGSIILNTPGGIYGFTSASTINTSSVPGIASNTAVAFAQDGSNFFMYVYIGGRWRSSSLL